MRNFGKLTLGAVAGIAVSLAISGPARDKAINVISDVSVTALTFIDALRSRLDVALEEGRLAAKAKENELEMLFSEDDGNI